MNLGQALLGKTCTRARRPGLMWQNANSSKTKLKLHKPKSDSKAVISIR